MTFTRTESNALGQEPQHSCPDFSTVSEPGPFYRFREEKPGPDVGFYRGIFFAAIVSVPFWALLIVGAFRFFGSR